VNVEKAGRFTYCRGVGSSTCQASPVTGLSAVHVLLAHADLARFLDGVGESDPFLVVEVIERSRRWHVPYGVQHAHVFAGQRCWNDWVKCPEAFLVELVSLGGVVTGH
jgi:hypothetical protein